MVMVKRGFSILYVKVPTLWKHIFALTNTDIMGVLFATAEELYLRTIGEKIDSLDADTQLEVINLMESELKYARLYSSILEKLEGKKE
jgi:hypothetical protein